MKYKKYPQEFWSQIKNTTKELKSQGKTLIAAFDADGTLWDTDLGENFFQYTIDKGLVPLPNSAWNHYLELKKVNNDPRNAYLWLAQIYKGLPLSEVQKWAQEAVDEIMPLPIFNEQQELIAFFKAEGVQVYVITASIKWAVEPGAKLLGLSSDSILGVQTKVENQIITDEPNGVITYKLGKTEALLAKTESPPFFASGNTEGDKELLESATHLRLAVSAANRDDRLYKTEFALQQLAEEKNWLSHRFI